MLDASTKMEKPLSLARMINQCQDALKNSKGPFFPFRVVHNSGSIRLEKLKSIFVRCCCCYLFFNCILINCSFVFSDPPHQKRG